ncbi:MAG: hypothetical protein ABIR83_12365 [Nakamurella sp.]
MTEQGTFEVVEQHTVALPALRALVHDLLDAVEEVLADDRRVPPRVHLALVDNDTGVVRIAQHAVQLAHRDWLRWPASTRPCSQAQIRYDFVEPLQRVVAGGVELPCLADQRRPLVVDDDAVDLPPLKINSCVAVAEACPADGAAVLRLVLHLHADVLAGHPDLHLVDDVGDRLHGVGHNAFAEVLPGRDQLDTELFKLPLGYDGVTEVSEGTGSHVDQDVVDLRMFADVGQ